jgi:hypothetical protein
MEKHGSSRTDFQDIRYSSISKKSVEKIQFSLKSKTKNGYMSNDPWQCNEQLDKVAKTNKSTEVYGNINTVCLLHVSAIHMAILREVRYKASTNLFTYIIRYKLVLITKKKSVGPL